MGISREVKQPSVVFTSDVAVLMESYTQHFGYGEKTERLALCSLAQSIFQLEGQDGLALGSIKFEKPKNGFGSVITIRSRGPQFTESQLDVLQAHLEHRLTPTNMILNPPIDEAGLKARLSDDEFVPFDEASVPQAIFAGIINKRTLPGVRGHGGNITVKSFVDGDKNTPTSVDLLAEGSCMQCGSAGTITLAELHRLTTQAFVENAEALDEGQTFGEIRVYEESDPNALSYIVRADGIHQATKVLDLKKVPG